MISRRGNLMICAECGKAWEWDDRWSHSVNDCIIELRTRIEKLELVLSGLIPRDPFGGPIL